MYLATSLPKRCKNLRQERLEVSGILYLCNIKDKINSFQITFR